MAKIGKKLPYFQLWSFSAYLSYFEAFMGIKSIKKYYIPILLIETNLISYKSPFYINFENCNFFGQLFLVARAQALICRKLDLSSSNFEIV